MRYFSQCPHCGWLSVLEDAGKTDAMPLVLEPPKKRVYASITERMRARARAGGLARAAQAGTLGRRNGRYIREPEAELRRQESYEYLRKPGRAGGVERARTAKRNESGQFAPDLTQEQETRRILERTG